MKKSELVEAVMIEADLNRREATAAVSAYCGVIERALKQKEAVSLVGFGTFRVANRPARNGRHPKTGEVIKVRASLSPVFKAGKTLRDAVN